MEKKSSMTWCTTSRSWLFFDHWLVPHWLKGCIGWALTLIGSLNFWMMTRPGKRLQKTMGWKITMRFSWENSLFRLGHFQ
jgi:hypothetical protein